MAISGQNDFGLLEGKRPLYHISGTLLLSQWKRDHMEALGARPDGVLPVQPVVLDLLLVAYLWAALLQYMASQPVSFQDNYLIHVLYFI